MDVDVLHVAIACGPLAVYLLLLAAVNLSRRPLVTTGARDAAALGVGISGFIAAGPMELFLPESAADRFGPFVWLLLLSFYLLCVSLLVLVMRPRLVVYNVTIDQLRPTLAKAVNELDADARWVGDSLFLPRLHVQLHLEAFPVLRNVQLIATGPRQSYPGWRHLENALVLALRATPTRPSPQGVVLLAVGLTLLSVVCWTTLANPTPVVQALDVMLRR